MCARKSAAFISGLSVGDEVISRTNRCLLSVYLTLSSQPGNLLPLSVSLLPQISLSLLAHQVLSSPSCDKHDKREARQISQLKSSLNLSSPRIVSSKCKTKWLGNNDHLHFGSCFQCSANCTRLIKMKHYTALSQALSLLTWSDYLCAILSRGWIWHPGWRIQFVWFKTCKDLLRSLCCGVLLWKLLTPCT
jgi:hypothetical protein